MAEVIGRALIRVLPQTAEFAVHLRNDLKRSFQTITDSFAVLGTQAVAGGALALGGVAQNLTGALALLPAVGAEATVTLGALAVGFQGVGKAIKDSGDPKKFAKDLEKLSPEARKAAIAVKDLGVQAGAFRVAVQDALFKDLDATITKLGNVLLPGVKKNFAEIAGEVNKGARAFAVFAESKQTVADLNTLFTNTKLSLRALTPAGIAFSTALRDIGTVGSNFLPVIADSLRSVSERFAAFIARARDSGQLTNFFAKGLATLEKLIDVLRNFGQGILSIFRAASDAGDSFLDSLDRISQAFRDFFTSDPGKFSVVQFLDSAREAAAALAPVLKSVFLLFSGGIAPILAKIGTTIGPAVADFVTALGGALKIAEPGIIALAQGFSDLLRGLQPALPALGRLASIIGQSLQKVLSALAPVLGEVVTKLADALTEALSDPRLIDGLIAIGKAFGDLLIALAPVLPSLAELAGVVLKALADILEVIAQPLADFTKLIVDALAPILPDLAQAFIDLVRAIIPLAKDLLPPLVDLMKALLPLLKPIIELILLFLPILTPVIKLIGLLIEVLAKVIELSKNAIEGIIHLSKFFVAALVGDADAAHDALVTRIAGEAVPAATEALGEVGSAVVDLDRGIGSFVNHLNLNTDDATRVNERLAKSTADAFGAAGTAISDVASRLIQEVFPGLSASIFTFARDTDTATGDATRANEKFARDSAAAFADFQVSAVKSIVGLVQALFPNFDAIAKTGSGAFRQISDEANRAFLVTVKQTRETLMQVATIFGSADFSAAGTALTGSFASGMVSSRANLLIQKAARQVIETVASWFPHSPAEVGPFSGTGWTPFRGRALVAGFAQGIEEGRGGLNSALGNLFGDAANQLSGGGGAVPNLPLRVGAFGTGGTVGTRGSSPGSATGPSSADPGPEVHVFIGEQELTQLVDARVVVNNRGIRRRALAGTGRSR